MQYVSTRGLAPTLSFSDAMMAGLARDGGLYVPAMAQALGTEPVLIIARSDTGDGVEPMPVGDAGIPNNHFSYAIQWFLMAVVWLGMTALYLWRITRKAL